MKIFQGLKRRAAGTDVTLPTRTTAQSSRLCESTDLQRSCPGNPYTQENPGHEKRLDEGGEEWKIYRLCNYSSGHGCLDCGQGAIERPDATLNDGLRHLVPRYQHAKNLWRPAGSPGSSSVIGNHLNSGEDNYFTTADEEAYTVLAPSSSMSTCIGQHSR